ncbi:flagellar hook-length control protein FliK [Desulfofundulus thermosubterraneus]|uniref:Hook-length control protein FliK n=1 Tax=Desulfofundulus thermosubterraneus DSM 16057 TaxID=1121432 RepID=A0A1M6FX92_9FIRM|nr:flagellar hook-length control protein FliK [Desulfofundulus thermosubterraneus]SHJ02240.1 hook-length control protein FliK [Desulfofundulus thermosubterraneus DSM 16057]
MEINFVSPAPERPFSPGGIAAGASGSSTFLSLLMQVLGITGESTAAANAAVGNFSGDSENGSTPGPLDGVLKATFTDIASLLLPAGILSEEPFAPVTNSSEGTKEQNANNNGTEIFNDWAALLAAILNLCNEPENKTLESVLGTGNNSGNKSIPTIAAAAPSSQYQGVAEFLPSPSQKAAYAAGQVEQNIKPWDLVLKELTLLDLQQNGVDVFHDVEINQLKPFLLQLMQQNGGEVLQKKAGSGDERLLNNTGGLELGARVPVEAAPQNTLPGEVPDSGRLEVPRIRDGAVPRQIVQDTTSPVMTRNDSVSTPGHNPAQYQSANPGGGGVTGTSNNLSNPVMHQENVNPLQMPALIGRVLRQAVARHAEGQTHLWFKLEPEHLGEVMIRLVYRHGDVSAYFLASNPAAGDAIESALPQLREALAAQNLHLQSASVSVGNQGGPPPQSDYQQPGYNFVRQHSGSGERPGDSAGQEPPADPLPGGINLFV